jgi:hypothetical protein
MVMKCMVPSPFLATIALVSSLLPYLQTTQNHIYEGSLLALKCLGRFGTCFGKNVIRSKGFMMKGPMITS